MGLRRRTVLLGAAGAAVLAAAGCSTAAPAAPVNPPSSSPPPPTTAADPAAQVLARIADVPVLCWHQLRDWRPGDSASARATLICPPAAFRTQLDALRDGGYTTISPDQHLAHLTTGAPLPPKPVLLTFDDSRGSQITTGVPELARRGMHAAFFVMTVPLGKPTWMSRDDVRRLHDAGHTVAAHTYDHHRADRYAGTDWDVQLVRPRAELEAITGAPVRHFAYPYGDWSPADFAPLDAAGYVTAYQLAEKPVDPTRPALTLRRTLVGSTWDGPALVAAMSRP
ncbi:polysaccharide deacetylase family protein [Actinomycetospora sp. TBRC 11914]|uniref:polysaccharide deacetylase family protein n=1 Tax=Actinomycetospora sp. TBRC 11914 TaxID=2729387 RepID=UPI00145C709C|nr:polysaccharide deacetylase family protein [Actinomycetospora sp. TBRC 11914]NMO91449.1 polysaccharide deacetylase family protein [Actinomycetospora sp. TBRC 11914]